MNVELKQKKNTRAAVILIHDGALLVMHRIRDGKEYYTFPGGTIEEGESEKDAAMRELFEETTIVAKVTKLLYILTKEDETLKRKKQEFFFLGKYISGTVQLSATSEEYQRSSEKNYYNPMWVPLSLVKRLVLYPLEIKELLLSDFSSGFHDGPKKISVDFKKTM
ncbi:NUDIX domain-containing protein [Candidatus Dependentiae bacterium]|nr:NUDIX domain-containing protein [Candidatus Dependentiae bacterium]